MNRKCRRCYLLCYAPRRGGWSSRLGLSWMGILVTLRLDSSVSIITLSVNLTLGESSLRPLTDDWPKVCSL